MSTNYYTRLKLTDDVKQQMHKHIEDNNRLEIKNLAERLYEEYHIGQNAGGWKFLFQKSGYGVYVPWDDFQSLKEYLNNDAIEIVDEYEAVIDKKDFFDNIVTCEGKERDTVMDDGTCWCSCDFC